MMGTVMELVGGLFKALGALVGVFLLLVLGVAVLYVGVYTLGFLFLGGAG